MAKVTVACKLPSGLRVNHKDTVITLAGAHSPGAIMGFGITKDVDGDWFNDWATTDGKEFPPIVNGSIFAYEGKDIRAAIRERAKDKAVRTGLEPLDPQKPVEGIEPTDEMKKELAKSDTGDA